MKQQLIHHSSSKRVFTYRRDPRKIVVEFVADINSGEKRGFFEKAEFDNQTNCNVFDYLKRADLPVAFIKQIDSRHFLAHKCRMLPFLVVVRRMAFGSYLKRNRAVESGTVFGSLIVEFYLKTINRIFNNFKLMTDNPYIEFFNGSVFFYDRNRPADSTLPIDSLSYEDVFGFVDTNGLERQMIFLARRAFRFLEEGWKEMGCTLADCKFEFGLLDSKLMITDSLDNNCWRILDDREQQVVRQFQPKDLEIRQIQKRVGSASVSVL